MCSLGSLTCYEFVIAKMLSKMHRCIFFSLSSLTLCDDSSVIFLSFFLCNLFIYLFVCLIYLFIAILFK